MKTKKHKVEIPEGYEIDTIISGDLLGYEPKKKETTITFKPIKKELPKTWGEYTKSNPGIPSWLSNYDTPHKYIAFGKLELLRDVYNEGWVPDWKDNDGKHIIYMDRGLVAMACVENDSHVLAFKTHELRSEFLTNFSKLIETAKPLL